MLSLLQTKRHRSRSSCLESGMDCCAGVSAAMPFASDASSKSRQVLWPTYTFGAPRGVKKYTPPTTPPAMRMFLVLSQPDILTSLFAVCQDKRVWEQLSGSREAEANAQFDDKELRFIPVVESQKSGTSVPWKHSSLPYSLNVIKDRIGTASRASCRLAAIFPLPLQEGGARTWSRVTCSLFWSSSYCWICFRANWIFGKTKNHIDSRPTQGGSSWLHRPATDGHLPGKTG